MTSGIEKNKSQAQTIRHRYLGKREDLVAISVHITEVRQKIEVNTRLFEATFGDIISQIGWANFELQRLRLTAAILTDTKGSLSLKEAADEAEKQLEYAKKKQEERDKELDALKWLKGPPGEDFNWKDIQDLRKQCGVVYRKILYLLHSDVTKEEDSDYVKDQREAAYRARAALELDFLNAMLAGLMAEQPEPIKLDEVTDAEMHARIKSLEGQIAAAQKVLTELLRSPMTHVSADAAFIEQHRNELEHELRVLMLQIAALNKQLAA